MTCISFWGISACPRVGYAHFLISSSEQSDRFPLSNRSTPAARRNSRKLELFGGLIMRRFLAAMSAVLLMAGVPATLAIPLGSQWTYQGRLVLNGDPVVGLADVQFQLFSSAGGGVPLATSTHLNQNITDGLFTVDAVQFGVTHFNGQECYIEVAVRAPAGVGAYTTLTPRQRIAPTPYALQTRGLYVDPALNVGIGTTSPLDKLHVDGGDIRLTGATARFQMFNFNGPPETETVEIIGTNATNGGEIRLYSGVGLLNVYAGADANQAGLIQARNTNGDTRVQINGSNNDDGGAISVLAADGSNSVFIEGDSTNAGGRVGVRNAAGSSTVNLIGAVDASGNGAIGVGESSPLAPMHVEGTSLSLTGAALNSDDMIIEDADAVLGLYSGNGGSFGSTIALGEMSGGALVDKWGITRTTSGAGSELRFTYGADANYGNNTSVLRIGPDGLRGTDAELASGGYLVLGSPTGSNVAIDNNEMMARNNGAAATLTLNNEGGDVSIAPQGTTIVRVLQITGADVAERFPTNDKAEPGMVMEIDPDNAGKLRIARGAYNRRVAGVVSGAGNLPVGAVLGNLTAGDNGPPVALSGRVWVMCDAGQRSVEIGDLMTTADLPGHAMAVCDNDRANGAMIGKAMTKLAQGEKGLVLVLVNLQ
jgi:hypothetical protein